MSPNPKKLLQNLFKYLLTHSTFANVKILRIDPSQVDVYLLRSLPKYFSHKASSNNGNYAVKVGVCVFQFTHYQTEISTTIIMIIFLYSLLRLPRTSVFCVMKCVFRFTIEDEVAQSGTAFEEGRLAPSKLCSPHMNFFAHTTCMPILKLTDCNGHAIPHLNALSEVQIRSPTKCTFINAPKAKLMTKLNKKCFAVTNGATYCLLLLLLLLPPKQYLNKVSKPSARSFIQSSCQLEHFGKAANEKRA